MDDKRFYLCVFTCIFNRDLSKILLLKKNKERVEKYGMEWCNIGGKIRFGEKAIDAGIREIKEEIGLDVKEENLKFIFVKEDFETFKNSHIGFFVYCTQIDENSKIILNEELETYQWFDINKLPENVVDDIPLILRLYKKKLCK